MSDEHFDIIHIDEHENVLYVRRELTDTVFKYLVEAEKFLIFCKWTEWSMYAPAGALMKKRRKRQKK